MNWVQVVGLGGFLGLCERSIRDECRGEGVGTDRWPHDVNSWHEDGELSVRVGEEESERDPDEERSRL